VIDPSVVGEVVDEVRIPVERGKVLELARAVHADDPIYFDRAAARAAGFDDIPAPLTFSVVAMHWRERDDDRMVEELGLEVARVLHGEAHWTYLAPIHVGDELHGVRRVVDVQTKQGSRGGSMTIVALETEYTNQDGALVLRQRDKLIERGA
jgi:acyl dehydratase